jgi:hypothetical protein
MLQQWPDLSRRTVEDTANVIAGMKVGATEDATLDALADPSAAGSALLDTSSRRRRTEHSLRPASHAAMLPASHCATRADYNPENTKAALRICHTKSACSTYLFCHHCVYVTYRPQDAASKLAFTSPGG